MSSRAFIQFVSPSGQRWRNGFQDTDAARQAAKRILASGVQANVAIALVHLDPGDGEKKVEPVQWPEWAGVLAALSAEGEKGEG